MGRVVLPNKNANEVMDIVREMRAQGMVQGIDFDFRYCPARWDEMIGDVPAETVFTFYKEKWTTWFTLKWT